MKYSKVELEKLRKEIRVAFLLKHQDDEIKKNAIHDASKSTSNSFLKILALDLEESFGEDAPKVSTLYNFFFDEEKVAYSRKTIKYFELYSKGNLSVDTKIVIPENKDWKALTDFYFKKISEFIKRNYLIIIGYVFSFVPFIVLPIASVGIYKNYKVDSENDGSKKGVYLYSGMLILYLLFTVLSTVVLIKFAKNQLLENLQYSSVFDVPLAGNGFVSVHNLTKKGRSIDIGTENSIYAEPNDTVIVSVTMSNISNNIIEDTRLSLTPRISGNSNYHKFIGTLSGIEIYPVSDPAIVYTDMNTTLKPIYGAFLQYSGNADKVVYLNEDNSNLIFSKGFPVSRVDKGFDNAVILNVPYVVETSLQEGDRAIFDKNPAGNGLGFFSINDCESNCANKFKEITVPALKDNEKFIFYTFVNYRNKGTINIQNAKVKLFFDNFSTNNELQIKAELSGENVIPIYDEVKLRYKKLDNYNLKSEVGLLGNNHEMNSPNKCKGYTRNEKVDVTNVRSDGILIGKLDTYNNGWCDEGYFIMKFEIEKADSN